MGGGGVYPVPAADRAGSWICDPVVLGPHGKPGPWSEEQGGLGRKVGLMPMEAGAESRALPAFDLRPIV